MKEYYAERNGLVKQKLNIELKQLLSFFENIYTYFNNKNYFEYAENGIWDQYSQDEQISPPSFLPSPEIYFVNHLQSSKIWPINKYYNRYSEETLFTVIEILYDHIAQYNYENNEVMKIGPQNEFAEQINNVLKLYKKGYYLEPQNGFIMKLPNEALKEQLSYRGQDMTDDVYSKLSTATQMYYKFDSNIEMKKKAINILADILEDKRENVKNILNSEYDINKKEHDKLIFGIVNKFNIRHNRSDQKQNYSLEIWYDWMMQYYTSVIIAYYRLENKYIM